MAKRPAKKSTKKSPVPLGGVGSHKCKHDGCKGFTVYMRRSHKTQEPEHYCAPHWKSDVEARNAAAYKDRPKVSASPKKRVKRKVKK